MDGWMDEWVNEWMNERMNKLCASFIGQSFSTNFGVCVCEGSYSYVFLPVSVEKIAC